MKRLFFLTTALLLLFFSLMPVYPAAAADMVHSRQALTLPADYMTNRVFDINGATNDYFGYATAMDGDVAVASSFPHNAVFVYLRQNGVWVQQTKLIPNDAGLNDSFGSALAIEGDVIVVGSAEHNSNRGAVYVYVKPAGGWPAGIMTQNAKLTASDSNTDDDLLGASVSISGDAIAAGANGVLSLRGAAYVFQKPAGGWSGSVQQSAKLLASDGVAGDQFGNSISFSGNTVVVGAQSDDSSKGAVYTFDMPGGGWSGSLTQTVKLTLPVRTNGDSFGGSVSLDGNVLVIGVPGANSGAGVAVLFEGSGASWTGKTTFSMNGGSAGDGFGTAVDIDGDVIGVGAPGRNLTFTDTGIAFAFAKPDTGWPAGGLTSSSAKLFFTNKADFDNLGISVSVSGEEIMAGAYGENGFQGAAYIFTPFTASPFEDIALSLAVNNGTQNSGSQIQLVINASNIGSNNVNIPIINALLPDGLSVFKSVTTHGTYNPVTGIWAVGDLTKSTSATLVIVANVGTPLPKTFTVTYPTLDGNNTNNSANISLPSPERVEVLPNGGFELYVSNTARVPNLWTAGKFGSADGKNKKVKKSGSASIKINGNGKTKTLTQSTIIGGYAGEQLTFTIWMKGVSVPKKGGCFAQVQILNIGSPVITKKINCPTGTYSFKKKTITFTVPGDYTQRVVKIVYAKSGGAVFFDDASLLGFPGGN